MQSTPAPVVVQVLLSLNPGGTERLVIELATRLTPRFAMSICCLDGPGVWAEELTAHGIDVVALERRPGFHPELGARIARIAANRGARVLHCHHYSPFVYGRIAALLRPGLRVVFTEHGRLSDAPASPRRRLVNRVLGRLPGPIYAVSQDLRSHLIREGLPADRIEVVYNGVDVGPIPTLADRQKARDLLSAEPDAFVIGSVGRLESVKDFPMLLDAFMRFRRKMAAARLVIVGDGPERGALEQQVLAAGMITAVRFLGYRSDIRALLPGFDLYVNSSISEGVSLTILEAMAAQLPIVATRVGGTPEVVIDGETGLLVPSREPEIMANVCAALSTDSGRLAALGKAGRARLERQFTIQHMVDAYARAYSVAGVA